MQWLYNDNLPIYTQLVEQIKRAIVSHELKPGEKLAPVRELALEAGVNPNTMQRAFQELERCELVFTQRSTGRYVTYETEIIDKEREKLAADSIRAFISNMKQLGFTYEEITNSVQNFCEEDNQHDHT